jgi:hypothetical protein
MGEQDRGFHADRVAISYWDALGNETVRYFAANLPEEEIPDIIDSPSTGLPAGRDKENPPSVAKTEPYKTHLAYVKERRSEEEAEQLLEDALNQLRARRGRPTTNFAFTSRRPPISRWAAFVRCARPHPHDLRQILVIALPKRRFGANLGHRGSIATMWRTSRGLHCGHAGSTR